jgi:hypothetical protein
MWSAVGSIQALGALNGDSVWLTTTLISILVVAGLGGLAALYLYAARYFQWLTTARQLQLARGFRVAFGGLFLAAALLPYLLVKAPLLAVASTSLFLLALVPIMVTREQAGPTKSETAKIDQLELDN